MTQPRGHGKRILLHRSQGRETGEKRSVRTRMSGFMLWRKGSQFILTVWRQGHDINDLCLSRTEETKPTIFEDCGQWKLILGRWTHRKNQLGDRVDFGGDRSWIWRPLPINPLAKL